MNSATWVSMYTGLVQHKPHTMNYSSTERGESLYIEDLRILCKILIFITLGIDHHWKEDTYATCGDSVEIWNGLRSTPLRKFEWGVDTVHSVKFNPIEVRIEAVRTLKYVCIALN